MKFHTLGHAHGQSIKDQIIREFRKEGFISYGAVREAAGEFAHRDDFQIGWDDDSDLDRRIRVRETKKGWFVYLPEPNAVVNIVPDEKDNFDMAGIDIFLKSENDRVLKEMKEENIKSRDIIKQELDALENIERAIEQLALNVTAVSFTIAKTYPSGLVYRDCTVLAKKSGTKEERTDRPAKFHQWANITKGVQQVLAIVEFEDGHVEQIQPTRVKFKKGDEENEGDI